MLEAEPRNAIAVVFEALGATNRASTALDDVVVSALGWEPRSDLAVLLPQWGAWTAPGVAGLTTGRVTSASELLVVVDDGAQLRVAVVAAAAADVRPVGGVDPESGFHVVQLEVPAGGEAIDADVWESAVALARRAAAHQILGATRTMLELARTYALERVQFGRAIASFQAVRHRLAEALVAVESLEATLNAAGDEPNALTASLARATAGRTARTVTAHCQQVLAGIGFTTDHPFHRYLKRTMLLEGLFGSADDIALDLGRQLVAARRVPTLIEL
jgi:alkylation response protein AidB-like acyl-CoA dehydrogenase